MSVQGRLVGTDFATSLTRHRITVPLHVSLINRPPGKGFPTFLALKLPVNTAFPIQQQILVFFGSMPPIGAIGIELFAAVFASETISLLLPICFQCFLFLLTIEAFGSIRPEVDPHVVRFRFSVHRLLLFSLFLLVLRGGVFMIPGARVLLLYRILSKGCHVFTFRFLA